LLTFLLVYIVWHLQPSINTYNKYFDELIKATPEVSYVQDFFAGQEGRTLRQ